jgi:hypothetical protein
MGISIRSGVFLMTSLFIHVPNLFSVLWYVNYVPVSWLIWVLGWICMLSKLSLILTVCSYLSNCYLWFQKAEYLGIILLDTSLLTVGRSNISLKTTYHILASLMCQYHIFTYQTSARSIFSAKTKKKIAVNQCQQYWCTNSTHRCGLAKSVKLPCLLYSWTAAASLSSSAAVGVCDANFSYGFLVSFFFLAEK